MSVGRIAVRAVSTGYPAESVRAAAKRMKAHGVGATVVIDDDVRPIGIVTDRDVTLRCVAEERDPDLTQLGDIMSTPVSAVTEDTPIETALSMMATVEARRMIVTSDDGRLTGILTVDDFLELAVEEFDAIGTLIGKQAPA
jgi:CBS domain-containing protein